MRVRPLPLLLVTAVAGIAATLFFLQDDEAGTAADAGSDPVGAASPESTAVVATPDEDAPAPTLAEPDAIAPSTDAPDEGARAALQPREGEWVLTGRVALPAGTPADEEARVVALQESMTVRRLGGGAAFAAVWGGRIESADDASPSDDGTLAFAPVDADGSFRLVLPADARQAHLAVSGRYLYSEHTSFHEGPESDVVLTPRLGAWITGSLGAAAGTEPIGEDPVRVRLFPDLSSGRFNPMEMGRKFTSSTIRTERNGAFAFRGVPTSSTYAVVARTERHAMPFELDLRPSPGEHLVVRLVAEAGATLSGRVLGEDGAGMGEIDVFAKLPGLLGDALDEVREAETDETGAFTLAGLPAGELELVYRGTGVLRSTHVVDPPLAPGEVREGLELTVERGASLTGRVTFPGGEPAADASVSLSADLASSAMPGMGTRATQGSSAQAGADGTFEVTGLKGGPFVAYARLNVDEGPRAGDWSTRATKVKLEDGGLDLVLQLEQELRVRVTDTAGEPVPTFRLLATLEGSSGMFGIGAVSTSHSVEGAEDGIGTLGGLTEGEWTLDVRAEGFADPEPVVVAIPAPDAPIEVVLFPTATVVGRVVDSSDAPVAGARVTVALDMQDMFSERVSPPSTVSDDEGAFTLRGLNPGEFALVADAEGFASSDSVSVELVPGAVEEDVVLRMRSGGTILGLVVDGEGNGRPDRMIVAQRPPDFGRQRMDRTDSEGRFVLENLEPGRWQITAMRDFLSGDQPTGDGSESEVMAAMMGDMELDFVEVVEGETVELVMGATAENAVAVEVLVQNDGEPVPNAMVSFVAEDTEDAQLMNFKMTDAEGKVTVEVDKPGAYLVSVQQRVMMGRQSTVEYIEVIPEVEEHELTIELPIGTIKGRVFDPDGKPLAGARVTVTVEDGMTFGSFLGGNYSEITTDEAGDYSVENLRPGTYSVAAGGSLLGGLFGDEAPGGRIVRGGIRMKEGQTVDGIDFHLEEPGTITGVVKDNAGNSVSGAAVFVRDAEGLLLERFSLVATGDDGRFRYTGVQAGTYFVSARKDGQASHESAPVRVAAGKEADVALRLELGTVVLVSVVDRSGKDVQARVRVVDPNGHEVTGMLSMSEIMENFGSGFSSKVQRVGPLAPGRYEVEVTAEDGRTAKKPVTLDGRPERKLKIRLR